MPKLVTAKEENLIRRYLIWCYKTTKEELDRIDRKFTQLTADYRILDELLKSRNRIKNVDKAGYASHVDHFKDYIAQKEKDAWELKFSDKDKKELKGEYVYLINRLQSVEKTIVYFLGKGELNAVQSLYENEMTRRILESREHK